jgi:hypothetical protein
MERLVPIDEVEADFRRNGVFLLVDVLKKRIVFYGYKRDTVQLNKMIESLRGRREEMVNFLIARVRAEGETT